MAIHRVGPTVETEPYRRSLGRVLVTIDDLEALLTIIRAESYKRSEAMKSPMQVIMNIEFDGGRIDGSEDLRQMSDEELKSLTIKAPDVQVFLDRDRALAVGDMSFCEDIYAMWARSRQIRRAIWDISASPREFRAVLVAILTLILGAAIATNLISRDLALIQTTWALATFVILAMLSSSFVFFRIPRFAQIEPVTLAEYRSANTINRWPKAAVIVAIVSAVIAAAAVVVAVLALQNTP